MRASTAWLLAFAVLGAMLANQAASFSAGRFDFAAAAMVVAAAAHVLLVPIMLPAVPPKAKLALLALLAAVILAPPAVLGADWTPVYTLGGILAAAALLTLPARLRWLAFALVVLVDGAVSGLLVDWHPSPGIQSVIWYCLGNLNRGLMLFAVTQLARIAQREQEAGQMLSRLQVAQERLRMGRELSAAVAGRLSAALTQLAGISADARPEESGPRLAAVADLARDALADSRATTAADRDLPAPALDPGPDPSVVSALAWRFSLAIVAIYTVFSFVGPLWDTTELGLSRGQWILLAVLLPVAAALQMYHGAPRADGSAPPAWPYTMAAHALILVVVAAAVRLGAALPWLLLAGAVLVRVRAPWSWGLVAPAPLVLLWLVEHYQYGPSSIGEFLSSLAVFIFSVLAVFALCRLPDLTRELHATRGRVARMAVLTERLRLNRDVHDLLGFHLSALSLKAELAARLLHHDPDRAQTQIAELTRTTEHALAEVRALTAEPADLTFTAELTAAQSVLEAAGIRTQTQTVPDAPPSKADHLFAVVLREATTNILRHSSATRAAITTAHDDTLRLQITNNGTAPPPRTAPPTTGTASGAGLANLTARLHTIGGTLTTHTHNDTFTLTIRIPRREARTDPRPAS